MEVTKATIQDAPELYLHSIDGEHLVLLTMGRADFENSIFLDQRIKPPRDTQKLRLPLEPVIEHYDGPSPADRPIGWIFHVAQCGSTLLARALDRPGRSLVLREPAVLRQIGATAGASPQRHAVAAEPQFMRLLDVSLAMIGKRWAGEGPLIAKANVPVNFIARQVMRRMPGTPAITLYFSLENYAAAILRTDRHHEWLENVYAELRVAQNEFVAPTPPVTLAERLAALWFAQIKEFDALLAENPSAVSLDASAFFDRPAEAITAAADLFGMAMARNEAGAIVDSELFQSYSKNPALDYDLEVRAMREDEAKRRLSSEIAQAVAWAREAKARHGLVEALDRPLIGGPVPLLD
jgi:hypothetical protein